MTLPFLHYKSHGTIIRIKHFSSLEIDVILASTFLIRWFKCTVVNRVGHVPLQMEGGNFLESDVGTM